MSLKISYHIFVKDNYSEPFVVFELGNKLTLDFGLESLELGFEIRCLNGCNLGESSHSKWYGEAELAADKTNLKWDGKEGRLGHEAHFLDGHEAEGGNGYGHG